LTSRRPADPDNAVARKKTKKKAKPKAKKKKAPPAPPDEDRGEVHELSDDAEDVGSLIAEVVVLEGGEAVDRDGSGAEPDPVDDLDAVIDDHLDAEDVEELIALTAAGGEPEDVVEEPPLASLDEELPIEVLDENTEVIPPPEKIAAAARAPDAPGGDARAPALERAPVEQDLEGAIDLGPEITPELRDRLLAQALAHSDLQDARYRVPLTGPRAAARWKAALASLLLLVAAILVAVPPAWVRPEPPARIDAPARAEGVRAALLLQGQQVDAYRVRFQRLPDSLDELPDRITGLRFVKSGNRAYQLIGQVPGGRTIIYDSSDPAPEFGRMTAAWAATP